jgi:hypothetical protein
VLSRSRSRTWRRNSACDRPVLQGQDR